VDGGIYKVIWSSENQNIFSKGAGHEGQISAARARAAAPRSDRLDVLFENANAVQWHRNIIPPFSPAQRLAGAAEMRYAGSPFARKRSQESARET
jgi:hypothetical protein